MLKCRLAAVLRQLAVAAQERLLRRVLGIGVIAEHVVCHRVDHALIPLHDRPERVHVARRRARQFGGRGVGQRRPLVKLDVDMRQEVTPGGEWIPSNPVYTPARRARWRAARRAARGQRAGGSGRAAEARPRRRPCRSRAAASAVWPCGSRAGTNSQMSMPASSQRPATPRTSRATCQNQRPPGAGHSVPGRAARVEPVDVDGDVDATRRARRVDELVRRRASCTSSARTRTLPAARAAMHFLFPRAPRVTQADLDDGAHPRHLSQAADRARVAVAQAGDLVAEVQVRVDVQDVQRPVVRQAADDHRRRRVVPGHHQRRRAGRDDLAHGRRAGGEVCGEVPDRRSERRPRSRRSRPPTPSGTSGPPRSKS